MKLTVIGPRMDMGDAHRNRVQDYTRAHMGPVEYRTGWYPHRGGWEGAWSMSRAINAGRRGVATPGLLLTPTDYIIPTEAIARCEAVLDDWPWWGPFHSVRQISQSDTRRILDGHPDPGDGQVWPMCIPGIAVRTEAFDAVGGMDERFQGWGPEDAALRVKLATLFGDPPAPEFGTAELWCERPAPVNRDANVKLYEDEYLGGWEP